jgi:glucose-6-phosphate 1-dehydrogenase
VQTEKHNIFRAMRPLTPDDVVRGQFEGYRDEPGVAKDSDVETFCAMRVMIDSWRWAGVPWYLRSGKNLATTACEVLVELKAPPQLLFGDAGPTEGSGNYFRFRISPDPAIAIAARVKTPGEQFVGSQRELTLLNAQAGGEKPYERLLADALAGESALFTTQAAVEAAWAVVDPVLKHHGAAHPYSKGTWGPEEADALLAPGPAWHNPA